MNILQIAKYSIELCCKTEYSVYIDSYNYVHVALTSLNHCIDYIANC